MPGVDRFDRMRELQRRIIAELHVAPAVDPVDEIQRRVQFLKDYLLSSQARGLVLGISGGQDSTLAGRLCQLAVEELAAEGRQADFVPMRLPYAVQRDEDDAQLALDFIRPMSSLTFNIARGVDAIAAEYFDSVGEDMSDFTKGNVKARARMIAQYAVAGHRGMLVVGTDHAAEAVTGFFTKFGDGGADVLPLSGLTKRQGRSLLVELGANERLYSKEPTADLLDHTPGQSDEANLGLAYSDIDDYLEGKTVAEGVAEAIEKRYLGTAHKRALPVSPTDDWWR
jgi:NAD+ synthase